MKGSLSLNKAQKVALEAAMKAADILLKFSRKLGQLKVDHKEAQGVVSLADVTSEKAIIKIIKSYFPDHKILAEESAFLDFKGSSDAYLHYQKFDWCWVIDPLDGTSNFLSGLDYYSICISLIYRGNPVLGVVYRPSNGDLFTALKGKGSYFSNLKDRTRRKKLNLKQPSAKKLMADSLLITGFAGEKDGNFEEEFNLFKLVMKSSRGVRRMGSAALDLCYVSAGFYGAFFELGLAPWDVAAAGMVLKEAGGKVSDYNGDPFHPFQKSIIGGNQYVYKELLAFIANNNKL